MGLNRKIFLFAVCGLASLSCFGLTPQPGRARPVAEDDTGLLRVTLMPASVTNENALWAADGGYWTYSGYTAGGLAAGTHVLTFQPISGWITPPSQTVTIAADQTTTLPVAYISACTATTFTGLAQTPGTTDGTGSAARFFQPYSIAVDSSGNCYVADTNNCTIREVSPAGGVTTLAGSAGNPGWANGKGTAAKFCFPKGIAVDGSGNLYVADTVLDTIRKVTPAGVVTTLAGSPGLPGSTDGPASTALFNQPAGIAVDNAGNVYVADTWNNTIRKITAAGAVTTLAGSPGVSGNADGTGIAAAFYYPQGIAVDAAGTLYVADSYNRTIRKVTAAGVVTTIAGNTDAGSVTDGTGSAASFAHPYGIAVDGSGHVFVADSIGYTIREVTAAGVVTTIAGSEQQPGTADGAGDAATFNHPDGIAVDGSGNVYVADTWNNTIRKLALAPPGSAPTLTAQPASETVATGSTATFSVGAAGIPAPAYQWFLNGTAVFGATNSTLVLSSAAAAVGSYTCLVSNASGSVSTAPATLTVATTANPGRLTNLSVNAVGGGASQVLTVGLYIGGAGVSGTETVLAQALGPVLASLGVPGTMPDPQLNLFSGPTLVTANAGWGMPLSNQRAVLAADAAIYATPLTNIASKDSATVVALPPGGYTFQVDSVSGAVGTMLAALYDDTPAGTYTAATPRLVNLSCLFQLPAKGILTLGFTIGGATATTVLIRADGPALAAQGVPGAVPDPQLAVYNSDDTFIAANAGWGGNPVISSISNSVYAQPFSNPGSADSAVLLTLAPGSYTVQVTSRSNTAGAVMAEVFEVP